MAPGHLHVTKCWITQTHCVPYKQNSQTTIIIFIIGVGGGLPAVVYMQGQIYIWVAAQEPQD